MFNSAISHQTIEIIISLNLRSIDFDCYIPCNLWREASPADCKSVALMLRRAIRPIRDHLMENKICKMCKIEKTLPMFHKQGRYYRNKCRVCYAATVGARANKKERNNRKKCNKRAFYIVKDSKFNDKKRGLEFDLDEEFVSNLIKNGCSYCEEKMSSLSVDRIDNSKGHLKTNIVASCLRCNFIRNDMPYEAWMFLVPHIKQARILGLFENWTAGSCRKSKYK